MVVVNSDENEWWMVSELRYGCEKNSRVCEAEV